MKMKKLSFLLFLTLQMGMAQAQEKLVALSFDDGPTTTTTVHMLDVLKKHQVKASFFVIRKVMISRITVLHIAPCHNSLLIPSVMK